MCSWFSDKRQQISNCVVWMCMMNVVNVLNTQRKMDSGGLRKCTAFSTFRKPVQCSIFSSVTVSKKCLYTMGCPIESSAVNTCLRCRIQMSIEHYFFRWPRSSIAFPIQSWIVVAWDKSLLYHAARTNFTFCTDVNGKLCFFHILFWFSIRSNQFCFIFSVR